MQQTTSLAFDGAMTAHRVGAVVVSVQRITPVAYRTAVLYGATGAEVAELSRSFPTEELARAAARRWYRVFHGGVSVQRVLDDLERGPAATQGPGTPSGVVLVPRAELPRPAGRPSVRMTEPQYRLLLAALHAGTAEITRGEGEASVSGLRAMARAGFLELITEPLGEVVGGRVSGWAWRCLSTETARRAGKVPPQMVPVPAAALATFAGRPLLLTEANP